MTLSIHIPDKRLNGGQNWNISEEDASKYSKHLIEWVKTKPRWEIATKIDGLLLGFHVDLTPS